MASSASDPVPCLTEPELLPVAPRPRVALVTGAGRGIGRAIALALAALGHDLGLAARTESELEAVAGEVRALGCRALALPLDVTDGAAVAAAVEALASELGSPLVLVNNAGVAPSMRFLDTDEASFEEVLRVNLTSAFLVSRACLPAMLEAGYGRIVNIASTAGKQGFKYTVAYTASKHGLVGLTRALALELATTGVTVNAVCPGFTRTAIADASAERIAATTGRGIEQAREALERLSPQGRLLEAEEVARVVALLCEDGSRGITGQAWNIDGGGVTC